MAYLFSDLQTEFTSRGFDYLTTTRRDLFLNRGYHDLLGEEDWPFLKRTVTGNAPLLITPAPRAVTSVVTTAAPGVLLNEITDTELLDTDPLTSLPGTPLVWWQDDTAGPDQITIRIWPVNTVQITVRTLDDSPNLVNATDVPAIPDRFRMLIVDYAVRHALIDRSNHQEAQALTQDVITPGLDRMRDQLLDFPAHQRITETAC